MKSQVKTETVKVTTTNRVEPITKNLEQFAKAPQNADYPYDVFREGDKAHVCGYTDVTPATVVEVKRGGKEVTVQVDNFELAEGEKPEVVAGGFVGHCTNQSDLKYDISRNENGGHMTFTLRKWRGRYCWTIKGCNPNGSQAIGAGWIAFYDYNF